MNEEQKTTERKLPVKKRYIFTFLAVVSIILGAYYIYQILGYQTTDDAYVETTTVSVSPKVAGQIDKVMVVDNQPVKAGQVVAIIEQDDYKVKLAQAQAAYDRAILNQNNAHANLNAANSEIELAQKDVERYENLYKAGAVSKQTLDKARTNLDTVKAKQTVAEQSIFSSNPANNVKVADADLNVLKAIRCRKTGNEVH